MRFRIIFLLFIVLTTSCSKDQIIQPAPQMNLTPLEKFFSVYEKDMTNTARVISEQQLVKNLTHLQRMNYGGNKYYPLEREALTKMIRELSSYDYAECILVNRHGTIIYTMYDDKLFAKQAEPMTKNIGSIYLNAKTGTPYIFDTSEFPAMTEKKVIFFGMPVKTGNDVDGVLITSVRTSDITKITGLKTEMTDADGYIKLHQDDSKILQYSGSCIKENSGCKEFSFRNLKWFFIP